MHGVAFAPHPMVRVGMIGLGGRGLSQLGELLGCDDAQVTAVADVSEAATARAATRIQAAGQPAPAQLTGEDGWQRLLEQDLDLVYITTGWGTWGFKAIPAGGESMAELIATGRTPDLIAPFALSRFAADHAMADQGSTGTR